MVFEIKYHNALKHKAFERSSDKPALRNTYKDLFGKIEIRKDHIGWLQFLNMGSEISGIRIMLHYSLEIENDAILTISYNNDEIFKENITNKEYSIIDLKDKKISACLVNVYNSEYKDNFELRDLLYKEFDKTKFDLALWIKNHGICKGRMNIKIIESKNDYLLYEDDIIVNL